MPKKKKKAAKKNAASFAMLLLTLAGPNPEEAPQFLNVDGLGLLDTHISVRFRTFGLSLDLLLLL